LAQAFGSRQFSLEQQEYHVVVVRTPIRHPSCLLTAPSVLHPKAIGMPAPNPRSREWRFQNLVIPLRIGDPSATSGEAPMKPLNELAYMTVRALQEKQQTPVLTTALTELLQELKPGNCITEQELVDTLRNVVQQVLPADESEKIFPPVVPPVVEAAKTVLEA